MGVPHSIICASPNLQPRSKAQASQDGKEEGSLKEAWQGTQGICFQEGARSQEGEEDCGQQWRVAAISQHVCRHQADSKCGRQEYSQYSKRSWCLCYTEDSWLYF